MARPTPAEEPAKAPLGRIVRLFGPYRRQISALCAAVLASAAASLIFPFLLREVFDVALPHRREGLLAVLALGMIAATVASNTLGVVQSIIASVVGQRVMHDLRCAVYAHLQSMSLAFFTRTRTGEIQSRIANDIGNLQGTVTNTATSLVANSATVLGSVTAMAFLDWRLTLVSLAMMPAFVWVSRRVGALRREFARERQQQLATISALAEESLSVSGFLLGRTVGRSQALVDRFAEESDKLVGLMVHTALAGRWRSWAVQVVVAVMPVGIYWSAGLFSAPGRPVLSIGTLVAFTTLQQSLFNPTMSLLSTSVSLHSDLALFGRVFEYLDLPADIREPAEPVDLPEPRGDVVFEGVHFAYDDGTPILRGIDLELRAGERLAVVGATGSGKTTLGYLVPRLYDPTAGRVSIDGVDVRDLSFQTLARTVGVVSQETYMLHASIADNLRFAKPEATDAELVAAARAARIHELIASLPDGYDTVVGERGYRFSGGERQRLAIARTMLRNPRVLILDEATSALDTQTEHAVQAALDRLCAGRSTITIAHRLSTIRSAEQIIVLKDGGVAERGTHEELLALGGFYAALVAEDMAGEDPVGEELAAEDMTAEDMTGEGLFDQNGLGRLAVAAKDAR